MPTLNYLDFSILTLVLSGVNKSTTICNYDTAKINLLSFSFYSIIWLIIWCQNIHDHTGLREYKGNYY